MAAITSSPGITVATAQDTQQLQRPAPALDTVVGHSALSPYQFSSVPKRTGSPRMWTLGGE